MSIIFPTLHRTPEPDVEYQPEEEEPELPEVPVFVKSKCHVLQVCSQCHPLDVGIGVSLYLYSQLRQTFCFLLMFADV